MHWLVAAAVALTVLLGGCGAPPSPPSPAPTSAAPSPVAKRDPVQVAQTSVVMVVVSYRGRAIATGSGVVVLDGKHIVTNYHVAEVGDAFEVILAPPRKAHSAFGRSGLVEHGGLLRRPMRLMCTTPKHSRKLR